MVSVVQEILAPSSGCRVEARRARDTRFFVVNDDELNNIKAEAADRGS